MNYQEGSTWRKWDLHVHTPDSLENHFPGTTPAEKWETYIQDLEALPPEVKVLGINDYLFIDGYRKVCEYRKKGRLQNIDTVLPVIEFRIKKFAGNKDFKRINFHVIFSDRVSADDIQGQFLNGLFGKYKLAPGLQGITWNATVTKDSLADLGRLIKATVPADQQSKFGSDIVEGFNNLNFDEEEITSILKENTYLRAHNILAIGKTEWDSLAWGDSSIAEKKDIVNKVDLVFISSETIANYHRARQKLREQSVNDKLLDCSDAHHPSTNSTKDRVGKCFTWVKADTTFDGLRQAIFEFDSRVYVGDRPPSDERVRLNPTKYLKTLSIRKVAGSSIQEIWFDGMPSLALNPQLVTIIGNKGSGKSAIADILGLMGNSHNSAHFSFLSPEKFLKKRPIERAAAFEADLEWRSGFKEGYSLLSGSVDPTSPEKVKYLPQSFLEKICSTEIEGEAFERELKAVIFSHMSQSDKLGQSTFDEFLDFQASEVQKRVGQLKASLHEINVEIEELENKQHPDFRKSLENDLASKKEEYRVHDTLRPIEVPRPEDGSAGVGPNAELHRELEELQKNKTLQDEEVSLADIALQNGKIKISSLEKVVQGLLSLEQYVSESVERFATTLATYQIPIGPVVTFNIDLTTIHAEIERQRLVNGDIESRLNIFLPTSLVSLRSDTEARIKQILSSLSEPFQRYQKFVDDLVLWESRRLEILGSRDQANSIENLQAWLSFLDNGLHETYNQKVAARRELTSSIFATKLFLIEIYRNAYSPVMNLVEENRSIMDDYQLNFDAELKVSEFVSRFLTSLNQGAKGSFSGKEDGYHVARAMVEEGNFATDDGLHRFLTSVVDKLTNDFRPGKDRERRFTSEQIRKDMSASDLYDFIFGLDYLEPSFRLRLSEKNLQELSPGERGALLLIFYLLLDKSDIPLVIDQPEENLDNQSVYTILVKFIKKAKEVRQVIVVTHNPNLAVVCDSEQVIRVRIEKDNGNRLSWTSGAIVNQTINDEIVRILEGTMPAFANRKQKYENVVH